MSENLTKKERLGKRGDLNRVFSQGASYRCEGAKLVFRENGKAFNRFAVVLVRKFGKAVERNYVKRIFREFFRTEKGKFFPSKDLVFILYPGDYSFRDRKRQFDLLVKRARFVKNR